LTSPNQYVTAIRTIVFYTFIICNYWSITGGTNWQL